MAKPAPAIIRRVEVADLQSTVLFQDVPEKALRQVAKSSRLCSLEENERLFLTRNKQDFLYIIIEGFVAISLKSDVLQSNFLAWRGPQQIIGELRNIRDDINEADIKATEHCKFIEIPSEMFSKIADNYGTIYRNLARLLLEKMRSERGRSEVIQMEPTLRQVAQVLINLIRERGFDEPTDNKVIKGRIVHDDIAGYIGRARTNITKQMSALRKKGIIIYQDGKIRIMNLKELESIAFSNRRGSEYPIGSGEKKTSQISI